MIFGLSFTDETRNKKLTCRDRVYQGQTKIVLFQRKRLYVLSTGEEENQYACVDDPRYINNIDSSRRTRAQSIDSGYTSPTLPLPLSLIGNYEFPRENIKIERIIGEGAFGQVGLGTLNHIWGRKTYTVAVKMLKGKSFGSSTKRVLLLLETSACVWKLSVVGKILLPNRRSRVHSPPWSRIELLTAFFRHIACGQGH